MKKKVILLLFIFIFLSTFVSSQSIDSEIQKITNYAENYETGNIDYIQLQVYTSAVKSNLNKILGAVKEHEGGLLKQEQIRQALGEPQEETKWVWVEKENHDIKLKELVPIWKKIIFDGKKIQIWIMAFPSLFGEGNDKTIVYRLHLETNFKKPQEQLNIQDKIENIQKLAETFNTNPSQSNAEILAEQSVNTERTFENYLRQSQKKCEDLMNSIFGIENKRADQKIVVNEISFLETEKTEAKIRLEMCEECEWKYINLDLWIESREHFNQPKNNQGIDEKELREQTKNMNSQEFKTETKEILEEIKQLFRQENYGQMHVLSQKLRMVSEAWNEKSNNIWEEAEKEFEADRKKYENQENSPEYWWIELEQEKRKKVEQIKQDNYNERKSFYLDLFSSYEKRELYYEQTEFEKRLVEEFKEKGEEICDNNEDDNNNGEIDCADSRCMGRICGKVANTIIVENQTIKETVDMYCISGSCQVKEEIVENQLAICGNHICEEGENLNCMEDCAICPIHESIDCSGYIIFMGTDSNNCPLKPICIEETEDNCEDDSDCLQPLCGEAQCVEYKCKTSNLEECQEPECTPGDKKFEKCENGEKIIVEFCIDSLWRDTGFGCENEQTSVCGNEECESEKGEDSYNCPTDCKWECGNGLCEPFENDKCDEDCNPGLSDKKDIGSECSSDDECMHNKCRVGKCSWGNGNGESCDEDWQCESEICLQGVCAGGGPISQLCGNDYCDEGEESLCPEDCEEQEEIVANECEIKSDCGNENDVCSNGKCVTLPERKEKTIDTEIEKEITENPPEEEKNKEETEEKIVEQQNSEPEPKEDVEETQITGNIISGIKSITGKITGFVVTGFVTEEPEPENSPEEEEKINKEPEEVQQPEDEIENQNSEEVNEVIQEEELKDEDRREDERGHEEESERNEQLERCKEDCKRGCHGNLIEPCVGRCVLEDEKSEKSIEDCEKQCGEELDLNGCIKQCSEECEEGTMGHDFWEEFKNEDEHKQEKGVFQVGGGCRTSQGKTEGFIWFGGWGNPFEEIQDLKHKYYSGGEADWCKNDLENFIRQRQEFEKGFNQEFAQWFFEKYLANSAENWEQASSGIFELYWQNVDNQREIAHRMKCLNENDINEIMDVNLISFEYETEFGKLEYWEEIKTIKMDDFKEDVTIISPYMKIWIFPPESFIKYEFKNSMQNHEFPGPPEEKIERENEEGLTEKEEETIRENKKFMKMIKEISEQYGGNVNAALQIEDRETGEIIFNLYIKINEQDILTIQPMLPEETPSPDITIKLDFDKLYDMILFSEKEMRGAEMESPPWDQQPRHGKIKGITNGIKMYFKARELFNSAEVTPKEAEKDAMNMLKAFMEITESRGDDRDDMENGESEKEFDVWEDKETLTGEVILDKN